MRARAKQFDQQAAKTSDSDVMMGDSMNEESDNSIVVAGKGKGRSISGLPKQTAKAKKAAAPAAKGKKKQALVGVFFSNGWRVFVP